MQMLVVEDDDVLADGLTRVFTRGNFSVSHADTAEEADQLLAPGHQYRCVLLDLGLPGMDGIELIKRLRARGDGVPVIVLTARNSQDELVKGLDLGADDYLTKPFTLFELEARVRSLLRRINPPGDPSGGGKELRFDSDRFLYLGNKTIKLSPSEYVLFKLLFDRRGRAVKKRECSSALQAQSLARDNSVLEVYFHRLRKKLVPYSIQIKTIRGVGYMMEPSE